MADYVNPLSMMPNPDDAKAGGMPNVMSGMLSQQRQDMSAPFIDMARQQMSQQTQTGEQTLQEFLSPHGQETRQAQRQQIIDEGDVYNKTKGDKIKISNEQARLSPFMTDQQIEQAKHGAVVARHQTHSEPIKYFAGVFEHLQKVPEEQRAGVYDTLVKTSGYEVNKLPEDLRSYQQSTMGHLAAARYAQVHTPEQEQKIAQEQVPAQAQRDVANINVGGQIKLADMNIKAGKYDDINRQLPVLERALRSGLDPETNKRMSDDDKVQLLGSIKRLRMAKLQGEVMKDPLYKATADAYATSSLMAITGDPAAQQRALAAMQKSHETRQELMTQAIRQSGYSPEDLGIPTQGQAPKGQAPKQVRLGGETVDVVRTNPDGSMVVRGSNGQERTVRLKQQ